MLPDYRLQELIDLPKLQSLLDSLYVSSGIPSAIIDLEGNVLTGSGWQDICTKFHRINPETLKDCVLSDVTIATGIHASKEHAQITCPRGLTDTATPLVINGQHLANIFTGQLFITPPDRESFRQQAGRFNFDERAYLEAFDKVPVVTQGQLDEFLAFLSQLAELLANQGLERLQRLEARIEIAELNRDFVSLLENTSDFIYFKDSDGRIRFCSQTLANLTGHASWRDMIGQHDLDVFPRDSARIFHEEDMRVFRGGTPVLNTTEPYRDASGRSGWISTCKWPLMSPAGQVVGLFAISRDITARRLAEEEARKHESRLKRLVNILQHPAETTQDFLDYALDQALQLSDSKLGYICHYDEERRQFVLNTWSKSVMAACTVRNPQTRYDLDETGIWGEAVRQGRPIIVNDFQAANPLKKGYPEGHVPILRFLTVPMFRDDRVVGVIGLANKDTDYKQADVLQVSLLMEAVWGATERRRAEEARRESESLLNTMGEIALVGGWEIDVESQTLTWTREVYRMHDVDAGFRPTVDAALDFYPPEARPVISEAVRRAIEQGESFDEVLQIITATGRRRWVRALGQSHRRDGRIVKVSGTVQDITERKQREVETSRLQAQLQQAEKLESVGRLAGGVAHDFNNMLAVILGHTELALEGLEASHPVHDSLIQIEKAARHSAQLTSQLLTFARRQAVAPKVLNLNDTVAAMLKMLQRLIGEDIALVWLPAPHLWPVKIDPTQVDQILANLCVNARDAITGVGRLTIETRNVPLDAAACRQVTDVSPGDYVVVAVSDTGSGMSKEVLDRIFEPFFTTKELGRGTGLGLATVYGILRQNGGFVTVTSEPGAGTTFRVHLPRHAGAALEERPPGAIDIAKAGGETILLVEDEPAILGLARVLLEKEGYTVLAAATPEEAMGLVREHPGEIHLLMTDVVMPSMNGRDLVTQVVTLRPTVRSLFMSGYTADIIAERGVLNEAVQFIQKPFTRRDLAVKVRQALEGRWA